MKSLLVVGFALLAFMPSADAKIVCEPGYSMGEYQPCLKAHFEPGAPEGRRPVDERRVGQVEKVHKNLDGSVTVWRHGSSDTEVWTQVDKNTWERKN